MNYLHIDLEYCYGIKRLSATLDFRACPAYAIYAPNGMMKSSFAQTFKDIANGEESRDRVFPNRTTRRNVHDDSGTELEPQSVLVLPPYDEVFGQTETIATLLVDAGLRKEYEAIYADIDHATKTLLAALKKQSGSKRDLEREISLVFTGKEGSFHEALLSIKDDVSELLAPKFSTVPYDLVSDEKVAAFLSTGEVKDALDQYINRYNELLKKSKYFTKGTFDYYNAATIAKELAKHGFFKAKHVVVLNADKRIEVRTQKELEDVITKDKEAILKNEELRKSFDEIEKRITKNEMLRGLQDFLSENEEVLTLMADLENLKKEALKSYLKEHEQSFNEVVARYQKAATRTKEIEAEAARQRTQWEMVIEIFNHRFFVPFKLVARNKVSVMLGEELVPSLGFTFEADGHTVEIEREQLLQVLSTGEKKALYILNVIFAVEVRRQTGQRTVFVVDDIADSFDYKNKYAIVQYLKDIADDAHFRQIILTHNFDFYRTINSRFVKYSHCLMVERTSAGISLVPAAGIRNVFVNDWKREFFISLRKRIAAISFVRNIVEYTRGTENAEYALLTAILHWQQDSEALTHAQLDGVYNQVFVDSGAWSDPSANVLSTIRSEAEACLTAPEGINFENKIVLSIAIRLEAEKHMVAQIADPSFTNAIEANQTGRLLSRYRKLENADSVSLEVLDEVALMTPENIHLNSFMYEPILDMSDDHLRQLYRRVVRLP